MNFNNITSEDLVGKGVEGLPDTPGLTTQEMQAKFDELVKDVMVPKFNALIDELRTIAGIKSVDQTVVDSESSIPTGKAVKELTNLLAKKPVYKSLGDFPEVGDMSVIYIDDTVSPRLLYTWDDEKGYVLTGGAGGGGDSGLVIISYTYTEYEALPESEKMRDDVIYDITDKDGGVKFGNDDISGIGNGTVTGAIIYLNSKEIKQIKQVTVSLGLQQDLTAGSSGYGSCGLNLSGATEFISARVQTDDISSLNGLQITPVYFKENNIFYTYYAPMSVSADSLEKATWILTYI